MANMPNVPCPARAKLVSDQAKMVEAADARVKRAVDSPLSIADCQLPIERRENAVFQSAIGDLPPAESPVFFAYEPASP